MFIMRFNVRGSRQTPSHDLLNCTRNGECGMRHRRIILSLINTRSVGWVRPNWLFGPESFMEHTKTEISIAHSDDGWFWSDLMMIFIYFFSYLFLGCTDIGRRHSISTSNAKQRFRLQSNDDNHYQVFTELKYTQCEYGTPSTGDAIWKIINYFIFVFVIFPLHSGVGK